MAARWPLALPTLVVALAVAGLIELALLRLLYRIGLFIPRDGPFLGAYGIATGVGSLAFDVASVVALALLALIAASAWRGRRITAGLLAVLLALAATAGIAPAAATDAVPSALALCALLASCVIGVPAALERSRGVAERVAIAAVTATVAAAQSGAVLAGIGAATGEPLEALALDARVGELSAIAAAFALAATSLRPRPDARAVLAAAGATLALGLALTVQPHVTGIVLLWAAGLTLGLPTPLYVAAFFALIAAIVAELSRRGRAQRGLAMVLLLVAGIVPQSSVHVVVAVVALALLAEGSPRAPRSLAAPRRGEHSHRLGTGAGSAQNTQSMVKRRPALTCAPRSEK